MTVLRQLTTTQRYLIEQAILKDRMIEAIKTYREATGVGLAEAKAAVDNITQELLEKKPYAFEKKPAEKGKRNNRLLYFIIIDVVVTIVAVYFFFQYFMDDDARQRSVAKRKYAEQPVQLKQKAVVAKQYQNIGQMSHQTPASVDADFESLYRSKINNPDYQLHKGQPGIPRGFQDFPEEIQIRTFLSMKAGERELPEGERLKKVPVRHDVAIQLDGQIHTEEWRDALKIPLIMPSVLPDGSGLETSKVSHLHMISDGKWLFFGCDVPADITDAGYDQFRFYFHPGLLQGLVNERIHVGKGDRVISIRQTEIHWPGKPPFNEDERWKNYPINDWGLYRNVKSYSQATPHRQYEAALLLEEASLQAEIPFTAFVEVETDPLKDASNKAVKRQYLGKLGSQQEPIWFEIR